MTGIDKATGRVVALVVLLVVAAVALRGYLPGAEPPPREQPTGSAASLLAVVALVTVSLVVIALAIIARLHDRRVPLPAGGGLAESFGGMGRPRWRFLLIGLGVIVVWLLIVLLLARLGPQQDIDQPLAGTGSSEPGSDAPAQPPPPSAPPEAEVFGYLAASTVILLLLVAGGTVVASLRQRRVARSYVVAGDRSAPPRTTASGPESLARAAELGLVEIGDLSREPREAIIACYAAMERALANAPGAVPQDSDTPSEVLARAVEHHALHADDATQLVDLFTEARFSPHVMNEGNREVAVQMLRLVLAELRAVP